MNVPREQHAATTIATTSKSHGEIAQSHPELRRRSQPPAAPANHSLAREQTNSEFTYVGDDADRDTDIIKAKTHSLSRPHDGLGHGHGPPPPKKRKLSLRQTTLSFPHTTAQPPAKITVQEPHGPLVRTLNGVRKTLDVNEDELSRPSPRPIKRSPAPPTQSATPQQRRTKQEDKRTLRSQDDGPRLKSELAIYFPNYEDIIFDAPREEEFLTPDTLLYVTDDTKAEATSPAKPAAKNGTHTRKTSINGSSAPPPALTPQRSSSGQFNGSPVLNLDFVAKTISENTEDPLSDEHFLKSHKRAERREKQLRNIEKERAMHEKVQLDRILDGLLGHDWLRVLGITGITDGEAKKYEKKRDYFVAEVQALVDKFKLWKEQEKKQRLVKEVFVIKEAEQEDDDTTEGSFDLTSSDLNASAARQLQQETVNAAIRSSQSAGTGKGKERAAPPTPKTKLVHPPRPPSPDVPITSFYAKRHLRDAALGKARHGRNLTAFGQPVPELDECEFRLPSEYITEDALRSNARERRRRKRESAANPSAGSGAPS